MLLRRGLAALLLAAIIVAVGLATPVPVLALTDGVTSRVVWLDDGDRYLYSHVDPATGAQVDERHLRSSDRLRVGTIRATDRRVLEALGWPGEIRSVAGGFEADAPKNEQRRLELHVSARERQRLTAPGWTLDLYALYGDATVLASAERVPLLTALQRGWRP